MMKTLKMLFLAIVIVGIAGGALAFKAQKMGGNFTPIGCQTMGPNAGKCVMALSTINPGKIDPNGTFTTNGRRSADATVTCVIDQDCGIITYRTDL